MRIPRLIVICELVSILALFANNALAQNVKHNVSISGRVVLPDAKGTGVQGCSVWTKPCRRNDTVGPSNKTYTTTVNGGSFKLDIETTGPFELRIDEGDGAMLYPRLSHLSGNLKIDAVLPASAEEKKLTTVQALREAALWGEEWNRYLPETSNDSLVRVEDQTESYVDVIIPTGKAKLFAIDVDWAKSQLDGKDTWDLRDDKSMRVRLPSTNENVVFESGLGLDFLPGLSNKNWSSAKWASRESRAIWEKSESVPLLRLTRPNYP